MRFTEGVYWILLISALTAFSVIDWVWIMPLHPEIGVNLLTDSIFMVSTIVFLSWLLSMRERKKWIPVERRILERITHQIDTLFMLLQNLLEDQETPKREDFLQVLCSNLESLHLRKDIAAFFSKKGQNMDGYIGSLEEIAGELYDVESNFSIYLEPELVNAIMEAESISRDLAYILRTHRRITLKGDERDAYERHLLPLLKKAVRQVRDIQDMDIGLPVDLPHYSGIVRFDVQLLPYELKTEARILGELKMIHKKLDNLEGKLKN